MTPYCRTPPWFASMLEHAQRLKKIHAAGFQIVHVAPFCTHDLLPSCVGFLVVCSVLFRHLSVPHFK